MSKPTIILATSNGVGMGHLARATAVAIALKEVANPIIVSMAGGIAEIPEFLDIRCEYIPGRDRLWMPRQKWDKYLRDRLLALIDETDAKVLSFDGVVPYPGLFATRISKRRFTLVWIRRGLWQKNLLRFALPWYSKVMDFVIEPGDIARAYDFGPTSKRSDAVLTSPVSLFTKDTALSRIQARTILGLDPNRPAVLVQLGTGDSDVNEKMTAALNGLLGWKDLQVVVTKAAVNKDGVSLAPEGLEIKTVRYFPLAKLLKAFDASICATGYNGVHELLPAQIPTVFVSNIRGTDDQEARARWCQDFGFALRADQSDLSDITNTVKKLQDPEVRAQLNAQCAKLPELTGGAQIAKILFDLATQAEGTKHGISSGIFRRIVYVGIRRSTLIYRYIKPHKINQLTPNGTISFNETTNPAELHEFIKSTTRFEHLVSGASETYRIRREEIASEAYSAPLVIKKR